MTPRRSRRRASIVLAEKARPRCRRGRETDAVLGREALEAPMPGQLLVLLSRLHRAEPAKPASDEPDSDEPAV